jgi:hypothetical protein
MTTKTKRRIPVREEEKFVRTSERTLFTKCRMAYQWSYIERRKPVERWQPALIFGDMIHRALAEYYIPETNRKRVKRGAHPAGTFVKIYDAMDRAPREFKIKVDDEFWVGARDLGEEMMTNYVERWREEDKDIMIIYPEMPFQHPIMDPDTGLLLCTYVGTTDALIRRRSTGKLGLFEHKTAATIKTDHLFLDEQASTYWCILPQWLAAEEIISPDDNISFMLYNFMRKGVKDDRPRNSLGQALNNPSKEALVTAAVNVGAELKDAKKMTVAELMPWLDARGVDSVQLGEVSKTQPAPLFHRELVFRGKPEQKHTYDRIVAQVREMEALRAGKLALYKAPNRDCGFCEWKDVCELHETGNDWKELKKMVTEAWSPYEAHVWALDLEAV